MITSYNSYKGVYTIPLISDLLTFFPMQKVIPDLEFPSNCFLSVVFEAVLHCYKVLAHQEKNPDRNKSEGLGHLFIKAKNS